MIKSLAIKSVVCYNKEKGTKINVGAVEFMKKYEALEMELVQFAEDVVTASGMSGSNDINDDSGWTKNYSLRW